MLSTVIWIKYRLNRKLLDKKQRRVSGVDETHQKQRKMIRSCTYPGKPPISRKKMVTRRPVRAAVKSIPVYQTQTARDYLADVLGFLVAASLFVGGAISIAFPPKYRRSPQSPIPGTRSRPFYCRRFGQHVRWMQICQKRMRHK